MKFLPVYKFHSYTRSVKPKLSDYLISYYRFQQIEQIPRSDYLGIIVLFYLVYIFFFHF